jgi:ABC-type nickel/cobalt efflux system permease component RcnA
MAAPVFLGLPAITWITMIVSIILLWGVASWALYQTLTKEEQKLELLQKQDNLDTYSPQSLRELREWVENHPTDPLADNARERYNECVETVREADNLFYDWSEEEIENLEKFSG